MLNIISVALTLVTVVGCGLVFRTVIHMEGNPCNIEKGREFSVSSGDIFNIRFGSYFPPDYCDVRFYNEDNALVCVTVTDYNIDDCNVVLSYLSQNYSCNNRPLEKRCSVVGEQLRIQLTTKEPRSNSFNYSGFALDITEGQVNDGSFDYSLLVVPLIFGLAGLVTMALVCLVRLRNRRRNANQVVTTSYQGLISQSTTNSYVPQQPIIVSYIPQREHDTIINVAQQEDPLSQTTQQQQQVSMDHVPHQQDLMSQATQQQQQQQGSMDHVPHQQHIMSQATPQQQQPEAKDYVPQKALQGYFYQPDSIKNMLHQ